MPEPPVVERWRLFVGVPLPDPLRTAISNALAPVRATVPGRWVRAESLHVTLCFLGPVSAEDVPQVARRTAELVAPFAPFRARTGEVGAFARARRPVTTWLGFVEGEAELASIADAVTTGLVGEPDARRRPHVTIARDVAPADAPRVAQVLSQLPRTPWTVDAACLFRSHLGRGGSRYETLAQVPLRGGTEAP